MGRESLGTPWRPIPEVPSISGYLLPGKEYFQGIYVPSNRFRGLGTARELKNEFDTRLNGGVVYFLEKILDGNRSIRVLDLGSGTGGNRRFLAGRGVSRVVSVDIRGRSVDMIGDAHALPFPNETFDLVLATAVLEHLAHPFLAMGEMARILRKDGYLLATASFWERWHDRSCFHFTPDGLHQLCRHAGLRMEKIWSGWGFLESVACHALSRRLLPLAGWMQLAFDGILGALKGNDAVAGHRLATSGSFGILARKTSPSP